MASTIDLDGCLILIIGIARTTDFRYCTNWNGPHIDLEGGQPIGIVRTIDLEDGRLTAIVRIIHFGGCPCIGIVRTNDCGDYQ